MATQENKENCSLEEMRILKKYTQADVAKKLYLRVETIEFLEKQQYNNLPGDAFIRGYLRAYAKVLDIDPMPLINQFNSSYLPEKKYEKTLWQNKREIHDSDNIVKLFTIVVFIGIIVVAGIWWQKNKASTEILDLNHLSISKKINYKIPHHKITNKNLFKHKLQNASLLEQKNVSTHNLKYLPLSFLE